MSDRGDYRPWYVAITDDPDFQEMAGDVFKLLFVLKMSLPASGIGVIHMLVTAERCGCTREQLEERLSVLAQPKPDSSLGWIVRDRNVVWIVNGLRNERGLSPKSKDHRTFITKSLIPLGDKPITRQFRSAYAEWFDALSLEPDDTLTGGSTGGVEGVSAHKNLTTTTDNPEPRNQSVGERAMSAVLITAMNQGMLDNPAIGQALNPVPHGHGLSIAAAFEIEQAGVSQEFAAQFVYSAAKRYKPEGRNRQIKSLGYLSDATITAWEKAKARQSANGTSRPAVTPRIPNDRTARSHAALSEWLAESEITDAEIVTDGI